MRRGRTDRRQGMAGPPPVKGADAERRKSWLRKLVERRGTRRLAAAGLMLLLAACGREPGEPFPPHSPPRPMTRVGGHVSTAQLVLTARPVIPPPGEM